MAALRNGGGSAALSEAVPISRIPDFGAHVSNQSAMNITAMYAGIRIRSENIASFPKNVKRKTSQGLVDVPDHPVFSVINAAPFHESPAKHTPHNPPHGNTLRILPDEYI